MFIEALSIITPNSKQPKCVSIYEYVITLLFNSKIEYYSSLIRNGLLSQKMNIKCIVLCETSQYERLHAVWFKFYDILEIQINKRAKMIEILVGSRVMDKGVWGWIR